MDTIIFKIHSIIITLAIANDYSNLKELILKTLDNRTMCFS